MKRDDIRIRADIGIGRGKIGGGSRLKLVSNGPEAAAR